MSFPESDSELLTTHQVRAARSGDPVALAWVIERFTPALLAASRRRVGSSGELADVEDLVQDVWSIALPRLLDLNPREGRFTPVLLRFLASILWRRHRTLLRRRLKERPVGDAAVDDGAQLADTTRGVITRTIADEAATQFQAALDALPPKTRDVVILRGLEQVPNQDVASMLGLAPGTVSAQYRRALKTLREALPDTILDDLTDE